MLSSTEVSFPTGAVSAESTVVHCEHLSDGRIGVVTMATPFHPIDHQWPDQPADHGTIDGQQVLDCVTATAQSGRMLLGSDIIARRGDRDWQWLVVHVVSEDPPAVGQRVRLEVDRSRRRALSAGHTGCHVMAFALNETLTSWWRKEVRPDSLGAPNFDQLAMESSRIIAGGSVDRYRIGKSLRKKGFTVLDWSGVADQVNERLAQWVATGAPIEIHREGPLLADARQWICALPQGAASVACGGTHLPSLNQLRSLTVQIEVDDATVQIETTALS